MHYLYRITNTVNNKVYIGQTLKPDYRWYQHRSYANGSKHKQYIHHAMAKYGVDNFVYEVIVTCRTQEDTDAIEEALIKQYDSQNVENGYNIKPGGNTSSPSEDTRQKMSKAAKARIIELPHTLPLHNMPHSKEAKAKIREKRAAQIITEEHKRKISESNKGRKVSEKTRIKISYAKKGVKLPNQSGEKHHNYGKPLTDEVKRKKSEAMKGKTWILVDGKRVYSSA